MKIILVDPSWPGENAVSSNRIVTASTGGAPQQNDGAMYVAQAARMAGHDATFFQAPYHGTPENALETIQDADALALSLMQWNTPNGLEFARMAKMRNPRIKIAVGGVQPSCSPEFYTKQPIIDAVFIGEGEEIFVEWLRDGLPSGIFRANRVLNWEQYEPPVDETISGHLYFRGLGIGPPETTAWGYNFTRGCGGVCDYCCTLCVFSGGEVSGTVKHAIRRLVYLKEHGIGGVDINNATFNDNPALAREFCEALIASGLEMPWTAMCGTHKKEWDLYPMMYRAGCRKVGFGIESPTAKGRKSLHKRGFLDSSIYDSVRAASDAGLLVRGYFMDGNPEDEIEEAEDAQKEMLSLLPIDELRKAFIAAFQGTGFYRRMVEAGYCLDQNWSNYTTNRPTIGDAEFRQKLIEMRQRVVHWFWIEGPGWSKMVERISSDPQEWIPRYHTFFTRDLVPNGFVKMDELPATIKS